MTKCAMKCSPMIGVGRWFVRTDQGMEVDTETFLGDKYRLFLLHRNKTSLFNYLDKNVSSYDIWGIYKQA